MNSSGMTTHTSIPDLPTTPGVYALYGGQGRSRYVAYVGSGKDLQRRIEQHLLRRDSSVATGTSAACLNPDYVTEVRYWKHKRLVGKVGREAAELVAYDILDPALRSRGIISNKAKQLYQDGVFYEQMESLFREPARGILVIPSLQDALERLAQLEKKLEDLARR